MIFVHLGRGLKRYLFSLTMSERPPGWICKKLRRLKPPLCPCCGAAGRLHGHGWRPRSMAESWASWDTLWFWRVRCVRCRAVIPIVFDVVLPRLLYSARVVLSVIAGRLAGKTAATFEPHRRTQKRWLDRFRRWWPIAQAAGAVTGSLRSWARRAAGLREAVRRCASARVWLVAPSQAPQSTGTPCGAHQRPVVSTHQTCPSSGPRA